MARLLYRLGLSSARHPWIVIAVWILLFAGTTTAYLAGGGSLSPTISISGTAAQNVADDLQQTFPDADRGMGTVVFESDSGERLTAAQQAGISDSLDSASAVDGVHSTIDPFATEQQRQQQQQQLTDGAKQIADQRVALQGQQDSLTTGKEQLEASGLPSTDPAFAQLDQQQATLDDATTQLDASEVQTDSGNRLLVAASGVATVSDDGTIALGTVLFNDSNTDVGPATKQAVMSAVDSAPIDGVTADFSSDLAQTVPNPFGSSEVVGVVGAAIVLVLVLGTLVAAGLPLVGALLGVGIGATGTLAFSAFIDMSSVTLTLGAMIGLAVGIDYALFILNRHRRQLREGTPLRESIGLANGTSGTAVLFAGLTVIVALLALNLTGIGFLALMGTVGAVVVALAVLIALTLLPALMSIVGVRIAPKKERMTSSPGRQTRTSEPAARTLPAGSDRLARGTIATRHPIVTLLLGVVVLLVVAIPAASMRVGLPDGASEPEESTQYQAYTAIEEGFGAGVNGSIIVVAQLPGTDSDAALTELEARVADRIMSVDNVVAAALAGTSDDKRTVIFQVLPEQGPSAASTEQLVRDLRNGSSALESDDGVTLGVTGLTASNIDISQKLLEALPLYLIVVLGLCLILLTLVFRSIAVPIIATAGFLLTILATLGAVVAVFQWGWLGFVFGVHDPAPIISFLPTILIGVVFGLAMDYQLFLVSGMRESYVHKKNAVAAILDGIRSSRTVIIAAAAIMIFVFGGFAFSESTLIRPFGFGLGVGVLIDAFLVRLLLVPAAMTLLGDRAWWIPRWLARVLPNVDVEGAALERERSDAATANGPEHVGQLR